MQGFKHMQTLQQGLIQGVQRLICWQFKHRRGISRDSDIGIQGTYSQYRIGLLASFTVPPPPSVKVVQQTCLY